MKQVYLDYNATTPLREEVKQVIKENLDNFGNPSSLHFFGRKVRDMIEEARYYVASLIGATPKEIIFTSCGSESNNIVLKGTLCNKSCCTHGVPQVAGRYLVTTEIEHPSVINTVKTLESMGSRATYLSVDKTGKIDLNELEEVLNENPHLVSIMWANNEIGTIQDISKISTLVHEKGVKFHTDAVQAVGKIPVNISELPLDYLSFSGHKIGAPKGIGVLYVKNKKEICPLIHGGHQEGALRGGTENTLGIISLGKACQVAKEKMDEEYRRIKTLRDKLEKGLQERVKDIVINGHPEDRLPGTLSVSFKYVEGESILLLLDQAGIAVSTGSACSSGSLEPSHVLLAIGLPHEIAHGTIRFSVGEFTTEEEIDYTLEKVEEIIARLRAISPLAPKEYSQNV
jgi:cysteine desulfurase